LPEAIDGTPGDKHREIIEANTASSGFVRLDQDSVRPPEGAAPVAADVAAKRAEPVEPARMAPMGGVQEQPARFAEPAESPRPAASIGLDNEPGRGHADWELPIVAPGAAKVAPPANRDMPLGAARAAQPIMETTEAMGSQGGSRRTPSLAEPPPEREQPRNRARETVAASSEYTEGPHLEERRALPGKGSEASASNRPRVHIGTVEIRSAISAPVPPPAPPPRTAESRMARAAASEPLARGLAWSFGLVQG